MAEKITMSNSAIEQALEIIPWLDYSDNAGFDEKGKLTIVDAEGIHIEDIKYLISKGII